MTALPLNTDHSIVDVVGIGFGPSNLALAIAIDERNHGTADQRPLRSFFFEKQERFGWHRGMLIEWATMQVSFLKDLVTLRNPTSRFSFLAYLHDKGRLVDFVNQKAVFPLRVEFHNYFEWAAEGFADIVRYGSPVDLIRPVMDGGDVVALDVVTGQDVRRTRNVVIAPGMTPTLPPGVELSNVVWHSGELLHRVAALGDASPGRFAIVGSGQSAAEVTMYLHDRFPTAEVFSVFSRYGYSPADDSAFVNRIFDPEAVDMFFSASPSAKATLMRYHRNTNYSVVDIELIDELYRRYYQQNVRGTKRLHMVNMSRAIGSKRVGGKVCTYIEDLGGGQVTTLDSDIVIYATGYEPIDPLEFLGELRSFCKLDSEGRLRVARDYSVVTAENIRCGIYLQGATERTHGLSSSLLSNSAVRAGEIVRSVAGRSTVSGMV